MLILSILGLVFLITIALLIFLLPEKFGYITKRFAKPKTLKNEGQFRKKVLLMLVMLVLSMFIKRLVILLG